MVDDLEVDGAGGAADKREETREYVFVAGSYLWKVRQRQYWNDNFGTRVTCLLISDGMRSHFALKKETWSGCFSKSSQSWRG